MPKLRRWKPVINYEKQYFISNQGDLHSLFYNKIFHSSLDSKGYKQVVLTKEGKRKTHKIHRLVYEAHKNIIQPGFQINHKNGIKTDNNLKNLEVVTCKQNIQHAIENNLRASFKGEKNAQSKLTTKDVIKIRKLLLLKKYTQLEIGKQFKISREIISSIKNNRLWKHC